MTHYGYEKKSHKKCKRRCKKSCNRCKMRGSDLRVKTKGYPCDCSNVKIYDNLKHYQECHYNPAPYPCKMKCKNCEHERCSCKHRKCESCHHHY